MSKKNKSRDYYNGDAMYDQTRNNQIADHLEEYVDAIESLFILEGKKESDIKKAEKVIRKAIKNLREGHPEKVFDEERFETYLEENRIV